VPRVTARRLRHCGMAPPNMSARVGPGIPHLRRARLRAWHGLTRARFRAFPTAFGPPARACFSFAQAVCNDGSPGAFYFHKASDPAMANVWLIFLEGAPQPPRQRAPARVGRTYFFSLPKTKTPFRGCARHACTQRR
jgi:hypothetical protein